MILDTDENPITSTALTVAPGGNRTFSLLIDCRDGYELGAAAVNPDVTVSGKAEPGDAFSNLETSPIDLTGYAPARKTFYFKIEAAALADPAAEIITINVRRP